MLSPWILFNTKVTLEMSNNLTSRGIRANRTSFAAYVYSGLLKIMSNGKIDIQSMRNHP